MFILPEYTPPLDVEDLEAVSVWNGTIHWVAYEGRITDAGELERRAPVFRTEATFWEVGDHIWETKGRESRARYEDAWQEPQWHNGGWTVRTQHGL